MIRFIFLFALFLFCWWMDILVIYAIYFFSFVLRGTWVNMVINYTPEDDFNKEK
jgi:hypothetical protein